MLFPPTPAQFFAPLNRYRLRFSALPMALVSGDRVTRSPGAGTDFREFRRYVPGDDLRYLDWNAYGRLDQLYLKQFETFGELTINLVLDRSPSMDYGGDGQDQRGHKLVFAQRILAALGFVALNTHDRVRLLTIPLESHQRVQDYLGQARIQAFLDDVTAAYPVSLAFHTRSLREVLSRHRHNNWVIIASDFQEPEPWFRFLTFLHHRRVPAVVLHLIAPNERQPRLDAGPAQLFDLERSGSARIEMNEGLLRRYREALEKHLRRIQAFCREKGHAYLQLNTATPIGTRLWANFKRRGLWV